MQIYVKGKEEVLNREKGNKEMDLHLEKSYSLSHVHLNLGIATMCVVRVVLALCTVNTDHKFY